MGRLYKSVAGAANAFDRFDVWVDPTAGASGTPDLTATGSGGIGAFDTIGVRVVNLDASDTFWIDEIRYASSFETVVVPEPGTGVLFGLGLLGLGGRDRLRSGSRQRSSPRCPR